MSQYTTIHARCPACNSLVQIETEDTPDAVSGNAGFVISCGTCDQPFAVHVGGNIEMSRVMSGGTWLETYFDDVDGSREQALAKYGLVADRKA